MVILNNQNTLIRVYSRSVSAAFIILSCTACYLFPSFDGAIAQLCLVASMLTMYQTYQDKESIGLSFYTFLILGIGSVIQVKTLWFVPVYWLIMAFFIYSLSFKSFIASLLGIVTPYWCISGWLVWKEHGDFSYFPHHFLPLTEYQQPFDINAIAPLHIAVFVLLAILALTGTIHFLRTSYNDKIRIRQIYYSLMFFHFIVFLFLIFQPQSEDVMLRAMIITTSPLIGHFISLTNTRITNIALYVILTACLILTILNIWSNYYVI